MSFREDVSRLRRGHAGANMALLRRWVLSMLRQEDSMKCGVKNKRLNVGWDLEILEEILGLTEELE